jgi:NAD(P)-dependent dehydrogenase (short-subunit alcohol dehydrogenase family)
MGRLEGRTAVVTGAARGLGRSIAFALAGEGAAVIACDRLLDELTDLTRIIRRRGGLVEAQEVDLAETEACRGFVTGVARSAARVDVLINNAAVLYRSPLAETTAEAWRHTLAVNLDAPFLLTQGFLPLIRERGGSIVNVSSRAGITGFAAETAYCASKFGIEGFTRSLAVELAGTAVSVNTVTPGLPMKPTSLGDSEFPDAPGRGTWRDPAEIAPAFVYLAALRGHPSGCRFDALRLTEALARNGGWLSEDQAREVAE